MGNGITDHTFLLGRKLDQVIASIVRSVPDYDLIDELYYNVQTRLG